MFRLCCVGFDVCEGHDVKLLLRCVLHFVMLCYGLPHPAVGPDSRCVVLRPGWKRNRRQKAFQLLTWPAFFPAECVLRSNTP